MTLNDMLEAVRQVRDSVRPGDKYFCVMHPTQLRWVCRLFVHLPKSEWPAVDMAEAVEWLGRKTKRRRRMTSKRRRGY